MSDLLHATATGDVVAAPKKAMLYSVTLTPAAATATVVVRTGGASGTIKLALQAEASSGSVIWMAGKESGGVLMTEGIHVTVVGAGALVDVEYEQGS